MVSQETAAKTIESTSSKRKVSRQRSLWRRSNCSRRSEMAGRAAVPREERFTALEALFVPSFMNFREARILGRAERVTRSYHFRTGLRSGNASDYPEFLNGTCHTGHTNENGVPGKEDAVFVRGGDERRASLAFGGGVGFRIFLQEHQRGTSFPGKFVGPRALPDRGP